MASFQAKSRELYKKICQVGVHPQNSESDNRQIEQLNESMFWGILANVCFWIVYSFINVRVLMHLIEGTNAALFLGFLCNGARRYSAARLVSTIPSLVMISLMALWVGPESRIETCLLCFSLAAFLRYKSDKNSERNLIVTFTLFAWIIVDLLNFFQIDLLPSHAPQQYIPYIRMGADFTTFFFVTIISAKMMSISQKAESDLKASLVLVKEQQAYLAQSTKMSALGEMASGVGHEINNPLTVLIGTADRLQKTLSRADWREQDPESIRKQIDRVVSHSQRIAKIVQSLRTFARDGSQDPFAAVSAQTLVKETLDLCNEKLGAVQIDLRLKLPANEILVYSRSNQISQILLNLITNASDAIQNLPEKWIEISLQNVGEKVRFSVMDSGGGIPTEVASRLMQPFFTTKEVGKGTGLGLSVSKGLAEDHQGRLYYDPQAPHTTFVLEIPSAAANEKRMAA